MKRMTAKEILVESFRELAKSKNVDKITVKEIVENCGYSTATFYRHFKDKYDLIAWEYTKTVSNIMGKIGVNGYSWRQTLLDGALSFEQNKEYLRNLLLHTNGFDSFIRYKTDINYHALKSYILSVTGQTELDEMTEMYVRTYCLGTVFLTCEWVMGKYQATAEELAEVYERSLPQPLQPFLYEI